jgi:hypothetical protein
MLALKRCTRRRLLGDHCNNRADSTDGISSQQDVTAEWAWQTPGRGSRWPGHGVGPASEQANMTVFTCPTPDRLPVEAEHILERGGMSDCTLCHMASLSQFSPRLAYLNHLGSSFSSVHSLFLLETDWKVPDLNTDAVVGAARPGAVRGVSQP